ncbi:MAG: hypothetical protein ABIN20_07955 [candidate division WOR-3 bacterium]
MIIAILFTHKKAPSEVREEVFKFFENKLNEINDYIFEKLLLATCYRVELYLRIDKSKKVKLLKEFLPSEFKNYAEILDSPKDIFEHIVIVASGADSPAIGEPEVQGQVKRAFEEAKKKGWVKKFLGKAFERAIFVSKKIREESEIQKGSLSIPRIVSLYLKDLNGEEKDLKILIVGTGEMGAGIAMYLRKEGIPFHVATKSKERAQFLKEHANIDTILYSKETLPFYVKHYDAVIFATESDGYLLDRDFLEKSKERPKLIIDLGFPRNVDPEIKNIKGIEFHQIDEFKKIIEERVKEKEEMLSYIRFRAKRESEKFEKWLIREEKILKLFNYVDKRISNIEDKTKIKKFLLYPILKSLRSGKDIEEIIESWIK